MSSSPAAATSSPSPPTLYFSTSPALLHASYMYLRTFLSLLRRTHLSPTVPTAYLKSASFSLVNPRHHRFGQDTVSLTLPLSSIPQAQLHALAPSQSQSGSKSLNPEVLLARFLKGFFNGWIFFPESVLLVQGGGWRIVPVRFAGMEGSGATDAKGEREGKVYRPSELPDDVLVPVGSKITKTFQVVGKYLDVDQALESDTAEVEAQGRDAPEDPGYSFSYVDVAFGADTGSFAGCHRLGIQFPRSVAYPSLDKTAVENEALSTSSKQNDKLETEEPEQTIEFTISCFTCNPSKDAHSFVELIRWFHYWYARSLLVDGVVGVLRTTG